MNGLLVGCRASCNGNFKSPSIEEEEKRTNATRYRTWPKRSKRSRKRKVCNIINQLKRERAISEIDLSFENWKAVHHNLNQDFANIVYENTNYNRIITNQKRNFHLQKYDKKLKKKIVELGREDNNVAYSGNENNDSGVHSGSDVTNNSTSRSPSDEDVFNENKIGIIKILKNWKLSKNSYERECQANNVPLSDTRSSVSSNTTLNENDSISSYSDTVFTPFKVPSKYTEYQNKVVSSSHLIQLSRPENLPPKPVSEQKKHQKEYEKMVEDRKKKERENDIRAKKRSEDRLKDEERVTQATHVWLNDILPNWSQMRNNRKTQNLWWNGLPPRVRGKVWSLSVGNKLNITREMYLECLQKSKEILKTGSKDSLHINENYEHSVELIRLDISRTFPHLCIFLQGGPYYDVLHSLLGAYVCYQPEIGYVQGMSFIAAVLLLNMDELDAFICFANLLDKPCHKAFYSLDVQKMRIYYSAYTDLLRVNAYDLYKHVTETSLTPDLYLVDWVYTLFSKSMSLDLACRIWDLIMRDGESFIFRAALGIMHLSKNELLKMDFLRGAQYLTKLPENISAEKLFKSVSSIRMSNGVYSFEDLLQYYQELIRVS